MKTIGMLGGMSWESTLTYYRLINQAVAARLGGLHSAKILLHSVDFAEIEQYQTAGDWAASAKALTEAARGLAAAGADLMLICTNTMHKVAPEVQSGIGVPLLHIAEATAEALAEKGVTKAALLGTKYTMTQDFYRKKLEEAGIEVLVPGEADMELVNRVIFDELCRGVVSGESKAEFLRIIDSLAGQGAEGVVLGCTEIGLLLSQADTPLPVFDTTVIHAEKAVRVAMAEEQDVFITKNGKRVAKITSAKADKVAAAKALFGLLPGDADLDKAREERLK